MNTAMKIRHSIGKKTLRTILNRVNRWLNVDYGKSKTINSYLYVKEYTQKKGHRQYLDDWPPYNKQHREQTC